jgi:OmpA-OmpF porin, OOP family
MRRRILFGIFGIAPLLVANSAMADTQTGFGLDRFEPSERGSEWFVQDTLDLRGAFRPAIGVVSSWAYKPLVMYRADGSELAAIVKHQLVLHPGASFVIADRLRFGVDVPVAVYQAGDEVTVRPDAASAPQTFTPANKTSIGDVRLALDLRLLGVYGDPFTVAIGAAVHLPTGKRDQYTGDENVRVTPRLQMAGDIGAFAYAARIGVVYRALSEPFAGSKLGTELTFGASAGLRLANKKLLIGPELFGTTVVADSQAFTRKATPLELIFGAHYTAGDFRIGLGGGPGLSRGLGAPVVRGLLSFEWVPGVDEAKPEPADRDGDGILDADDACADVKGIRTDDPKTNGCPPPKDSDGDGILDDKDACATTPGVASEDPKKNGCPPDKDGDGILDAQDACIDVAGAADPDPKKNGCPPDKDGDGIADAQDACVDVAGVANADPTKNGCPPDRDADTIIDPEDACPDAAGPKNNDPKKNGCPAIAIVEKQIKILEQVKFKTNSAEILKESDDLLQGIAKILKDHPEITKVRVEGHTDNKGNKALNKDLSKRRAASVVTWLVKKGGVDAKRFESVGLGQDVPIDSNDTEEGRQNNRRVEFHIVDDKGGTTNKVEEKK